MGASIPGDIDRHQRNVPGASDDAGAGRAGSGRLLCDGNRRRLLAGRAKLETAYPGTMLQTVINNVPDNSQIWNNSSTDNLSVGGCKCHRKQHEFR